MWPLRYSTFFCLTYYKIPRRKWVSPERTLMLLCRFLEEVSDSHPRLSSLSKDSNSSVGPSLCWWFGQVHFGGRAVSRSMVPLQVFIGSACRLPPWTCSSGVSTSSLPRGARYHRGQVRLWPALYREKARSQSICTHATPPTFSLMNLPRLVPVSVSLPSSVVSSHIVSHGLWDDFEYNTMYYLLS